MIDEKVKNLNERKTKDSRIKELEEEQRLWEEERIRMKKIIEEKDTAEDQLKNEVKRMKSRIKEITEENATIREIAKQNEEEIRRANEKTEEANV